MSFLYGLLLQGSLSVSTETRILTYKKYPDNFIYAS